MGQMLLPSVQNQKLDRRELNGKSRVSTREEQLIELSSRPVSYQVVHEIRGRIRFRIPKIIKDLDYLQNLQALAALDDRIIRLKISRIIGSVTFYYHPQQLNPKQKSASAYFSHLIQLANQAAVSRQREEILKQADNAQSKLTWQSLNLPLVATLLAVIGGPLGISIPGLIIGGMIAVATVPVARRAIQSVCQLHKVNVDCLDLTAISLLTMQNRFLTSCSMLVLIELGETIREHTTRSSQRKTLDLLSSLSQSVWVERNGEKEKISLKELKPEDTVIVYPGEQIPVDGQILRGQALIDEQKLTGESMPVVKQEKEMVYASTLVREGQIYILAERLGADTRAGQTMKLLQDVPVHDTRMENYVAKVADRTVVPTFLLGGVVFALTRNPARVASILTIDFATGIRVSVPTTVMASLMGAARQGILIRSGRALEKLAQVDAIVFDKTGTLTQGNVQVISIKTARESISTLDVLELAAAAEQRITHPVAEAVINCANYHELVIPPRGEWNYQVGLGIRAQIQEQSVLVGSERFLREEGISLDQLYQRHPDVKQAQEPIIYVASNGQILGSIQYSDPLRSESPKVVKILRQTIGAQIHILTGDSRQRAQTVAEKLDIPSSHTHAEAFPETKAQLIQSLHQQGKTVAFVGDGLNDSVALAYADVSISFRDGSEVARETADVVLMRNNLEDLVVAINLARHAREIIYQNTGLVLIPNLYGLALAATVGLHPMSATVINNGSSVLAGVNGLRPVLMSQSEN
jgi:Cu2+-exporting ATPase